ncbi:MAG TPA: helix-turn-helix transcriptional regulator [Paludibacter sp.]|jgi:DNA-binding XRE family transcriptional regulator|nr:helix-turn-helix transcriptional regulator [Paludibacter sp.]
MNIQIIKHHGEPEYAIIPFDKWKKIISRLEEMEDIHDARKIAASIAAGEETFPADFIKRLSSGKSRFKVWREYRKLTLAQLAKACEVSIPAISQVENGKRTPSVDLLVKLSKTLRCEMEDLV